MKSLQFPLLTASLLSVAAMGYAQTASTLVSQAEWDAIRTAESLTSNGISNVKVSPSGQITFTTARFDTGGNTASGGTYDQIVLLDMASLGGTPAAERVITTADIESAIQAGTAATSYSVARIDSYDYLANGDIVAIVIDTSTFDEAIVSIDPGTGTATPISVSSLESSADGAVEITGVGNVAYVSMEADFSAPPADVIREIDFGASPATDGTQVLADVITVADIETQTGVSGIDAGSGFEVRIGPFTTDGTDLIVGTSNRSISAAPDSLVRVTGLGGAPAASLIAAAADIETDLGSTDIGYDSLALDSDGNLYFFNEGGDGAADEGIVRIDGTTGDATLFVPEADLAEAMLAGQTDVDDTTLITRQLAYDAANSRLVFSGITAAGGSASLIEISLATTSVQDWTVLY